MCFAVQNPTIKKIKDNLYTISNVILGAVRELFVGVVACAAFAVWGKGI